MSLTALALVAPGDIITSAQQNIVRTNFGVVDSRTGGDPGSTGLIAVSNGATSSVWTAALTAVLNALGYTPANKAGDGFSGDITAVNITASAAMTAGSFAGGSTATGTPSVRGLNVGIGGFAVTGPYNSSGDVSPGSYSGGSTSAGTPSVFGLNVGTNGIAIVGGPFSGVTGVFTSTVQAASQFISTISDGVSAVFAIDPAQANVAVPNLKAARATLADTIADGAVSTTAKLAAGIITAAKMVAGTLTDAEVAAANKDGTTSTPSLRTLGTGAAQAAAGNHTHATTASGTYSGNGGASQTVALGISARVVHVVELTDASNGGFWMCSSGKTVGSVVIAGSAGIWVDPTVGISGTNLQAGLFPKMNTTGKTYTWSAIA